MSVEPFTCEACGRALLRNNREEAIKEALEAGYAIHDAPEDYGTVCDDCYKMIKAQFPEHFTEGKDSGHPPKRSP